MKNKKPENYAAAYVTGIYPRCVEIGRKMGYAIALHGSVARDLDLVAIPWTADAAFSGHLLSAICEEFDIEPNCEVTIKPHGRKSWSLPLWWGAYIDLSIMPLIEGE